MKLINFCNEESKHPFIKIIYIQDSSDFFLVGIDKKIIF